MKGVILPKPSGENACQRTSLFTHYGQTMTIGNNEIMLKKPLPLSILAKTKKCVACLSSIIIKKRKRKKNTFGVNLNIGHSQEVKYSVQ